MKRIKIEPPRGKLNPNEQKVYNYAKQGLSRHEIARKMGISTRGDFHMYGIPVPNVDDFIQEIRRKGYTDI